jgi:hypothetical protein
VGYESGSSVQSDTTQLGLTLVIGPLAAVVFVAGGVLAARSPLTRAAQDLVMTRVQVRRAAAAALLDSAEQEGIGVPLPRDESAGRPRRQPGVEESPGSTGQGGR